MSAIGRFFWYELRTTDVAGAAAFYGDLLGLEVGDGTGGVEGVVLRAGGQPVAAVSQLPAPAVARGATAHWLGHVGVEDVEAMASRIIGAGGMALGPMRRGADGAAVAILRDPFGAVLALARPPEAAAPAAEAIVWRELHVGDRERAWALYGELFGWRATEAIELGEPAGRYQMFAWADGGRSVGAMLSNAHRPDIHTHWFMYFGVADLDRAIATVRARGLVAYGPIVGPRGRRIAVCDDPWGAAFSLEER